MLCRGDGVPFDAAFAWACNDVCRKNGLALCFVDVPILRLARGMLLLVPPWRSEGIFKFELLGTRGMLVVLVKVSGNLVAELFRRLRVPFDDDEANTAGNTMSSLLLAPRKC